MSASDLGDTFAISPFVIYRNLTRTLRHAHLSLPGSPPGHGRCWHRLSWIREQAIPHPYAVALGIRRRAVMHAVQQAAAGGAIVAAAVVDYICSSRCGSSGQQAGTLYALPPLTLQPNKTATQAELHESPYTIPNALTLARIASCPVLAWSIVDGNYELATGILVASGFTDWVRDACGAATDGQLDGYLARKWNQKSVLGSIIDPMADKMLMTTLVVCLTYQGLVPRKSCMSHTTDRASAARDPHLWKRLCALNVGILPPVHLAPSSCELPDLRLTHTQRTLKRYFDVSMPSAEVKPTQISKVSKRYGLS